MTLEGTSKAPRKFTLGEISVRVTLALTNALTDELLCSDDELVAYIQKVTSALRDLGLIKKEKSDYNFVQDVLAYRVLNPKVDNGLLQDLYNKGTYTITLTSDEHKAFKGLVNPRSESQPTWTIKKGIKGDSNSSYSSNFGTIK